MKKMKMQTTSLLILKKRWLQLFQEMPSSHIT
uniref:Uncharacterized protein n=1 Tax=Nymphaea colorata TaxID=210225 RepID=A0A5K1C4G2_9MAGN